MNPQPCPLCPGEFPEDEMFAHLRDEHPAENWGAHSTWENQPTRNGQTVIGVGRRVAYALAIWPTDAAPRNIIRAMLPELGRAPRSSGHRHKGHVQATHSRTTNKFGNALYDMERAGLIQRGQRYIRILDRDELFRRAVDRIEGERVEFLAIERAVAPARQAVAEATAQRARELALRDLQMVYDLMKANLGAYHSGRKAVRHVPHGWRGRPA